MEDNEKIHFFYKDGPKAIFEKARYFISKGDYAKSKEILDEFLIDHANSTVGNLYAGVSCLYMDDIPTAKKYFEECRKLSPDNYLAEDYCLLCSFLEGDDSIALQFDLKNLHASSEFTSFLYRALASRIIEIGLESGEIVPAEKKDEISENIVETTVNEESPDNSEESNKNIEENEESLQEELPKEQESNISDKNVDTKSEDISDKSKCHNRDTLLGVTEAFFDEFIAYMYFTAGKFFSDKEDFIRAEKMFRTALERSQDIRRIHFCFGETLFMLKKFDEAYKELEMALKEEGDAPETLYYLASCYKHKGDYSKAKELFNSALVQFEKFPEIHCALGEIALIEGDKDKALEFFSKAADGDAMILEEVIKQAKEKISNLNNKSSIEVNEDNN